MPYIGTEPLTGQFKKLDAITVVNGQAAYTLNHNSAAYKPATANALLVSVNGVIQAAGDAFTISGSTITFTENLVTGDVIDFIIALGDTGSAVTPVDGSVTKAKMGTTELDLATIKDSTGNTTALTIDSSGRIFQPAKPIMSLRGALTFSSSSPFTTDTAPNTGGDIGAISNLREVTAWSQTHINQGGMYGNDGRLTAPVAGIYQFTISCSRTYSQSDESRSLWVVHRPAGSSSVETIYYTWTASDYGWYTHSFTHIMTLAVNDQISVGAYGSYKWHPDIVHAHFSGQLIG